MIPSFIELRINTATEDEIRKHLLLCDDRFEPPLSSRVGINEYASKLATRSVTFEAFAGPELAGLVAAYFGAETVGEAFISNVSVLSDYEGLGLASRLMELCIDHARSKNSPAIVLEVEESNERAVCFYERLGFRKDPSLTRPLRMCIRF